MYLSNKIILKCNLFSTLSFHIKLGQTQQSHNLHTKYIHNISRNLHAYTDSHTQTHTHIQLLLTWMSIYANNTLHTYMLYKHTHTHTQTHTLTVQLLSGLIIGINFPSYMCENGPWPANNRLPNTTIHYYQIQPSIITKYNHPLSTYRNQSLIYHTVYKWHTHFINYLTSPSCNIIIQIQIRFLMAYSTQ